MSERSLTGGPNFNPTPKDRFQQFSQSAAKHHALLESDDLQRALDHAELECNRIWALTIKDTAGAMSVGYKVQGLREFLTVFKMLAEEPLIQQKQQSDNLTHR